MTELVRKELKSFFVSLSGYVVLLFFLLANGLFLWVLPGNFNIPDSGMAELQPFFVLAPWLYLFLVPAICMRLFAEEKRSGTLELLFTRPVSLWQIVLAKYLAGFILVGFSLLPTIVYPLSLWILALPAGHIDVGGIVGSYIGLLFLSGIYVAVGVFASSLTDNQIVAFLYALALAFMLSLGLDFLGDIPALSDMQDRILFWGISYHYEPMSRGVIAFGDLCYFVSVIFLFLWLTVRKFHGSSLRGVYVFPGFILLNLLLSEVVWQADITRDKRYTLSDQTCSLVKNSDREIRVDIFLAGKLPAGIQKIQYALTRMLEEFRRISGHNFRYELIDPSSIQDNEEKKALVKYLTERGILPLNLNRRTSDETLSQQLIFPGLILYDQHTEVSIHLLQNVPGWSPEQNINHSIESLEYELTRAIRLLMRKEQKSVAFLTGHGELPYAEVMDMVGLLAYYYQVDFVDCDSLASDLGRYEALIIAKPAQDFTERDKYILDQYVMNGGNLLWCIDEVDVEHELLRQQESVAAVYRPLNIEDMLFRYGVRINPELLLDGNSVLIPVVTGMNGNTPVYHPAPWYFSPLLLPGQKHPVTAGIQPVRVDYANSIDTVGGSDGLKKTVLLSTSSYTAALRTPCPVSLAITEEKMTPEKFHRSHVPVAVAVEGAFRSLFQYRRMDDAVDMPFKSRCGYGRMIFIADGDVVRNKVRGVGQNAAAVPLGYDDYSGQLYGNRDFMLNCINWLCDDGGWMQLRGRSLEMYLLDKTRLKAERFWWEMFNLLVPLLFVALWGIFFMAFRRK